MSLKPITSIFALYVGIALAAATSGATDKVQAVQTKTTLTDVLAPGPTLRFVVAPAGNQVRYRVREQLAGFDLPNDAVGKNASVSGMLGVDGQGRVLANVSKFVVNASAFASDRDRRDGYVRGRVLNVEQYPTVVLVPTEVRGLTLPLPISGSRTFELLGDLTVRGVTRPTSWHVTAEFSEGRIVGSATTDFTFAHFSLQKPRVPIVLSVADTIRLEYDFNLVRDRESGA
ncbi:MAG: YceI family protein [Gemmatimonadaceae bacterium]